MSDEKEMQEIEEMRKIRLFKFDNLTLNEKIAMIRIYDEYKSACKKHKPFNSCHEAYAVMMEEVEEWWHLVKNHDKKWGGIDNQKNEIQAVGAMAMRFLVEM